jgi:hypothetical protein
MRRVCRAGDHMCMTTAPEMDTRNIADIVRRFFAAVSFEIGHRPSYEAIRDLFLADGRLIKNSGAAPEVTTVAEFIDARQKMVDAGLLKWFHESEISATTEVFGNIAHRLSIYEKRGYSGETPLDGRGVISTQFVRTPAGWKISSMAWDDERPGLAIADAYRQG